MLRISKLENYVCESMVVLLFLTKNYIWSDNCTLERSSCGFH